MDRQISPIYNLCLSSPTGCERWIDNAFREKFIEFNGRNVLYWICARHIDDYSNSHQGSDQTSEQASDQEVEDVSSGGVFIQNRSKNIPSKYSNQITKRNTEEEKPSKVS